MVSKYAANRPGKLRLMETLEIFFHPALGTNTALDTIFQRALFHRPNKRDGKTRGGGGCISSSFLYLLPGTPGAGMSAIRGFSHDPSIPPTPPFFTPPLMG